MEFGPKNITRCEAISTAPNMRVTGGLRASKYLSDINPKATQPPMPVKVFRLIIPPASIKEQPLISWRYNTPQLFIAYLVTYIVALARPNIQIDGNLIIFNWFFNTSLKLFETNSFCGSLFQDAILGRPKLFGLFCK